MSTCPPPVRNDCAPSVPAALAARDRMALFARVAPAGKLIVLVGGRGPAPGNRVIRPLHSGAIAVTLIDTDTASAGMPHSPAAVKIRGTPEASARPAIRVSTSRQGATV